MSEEQNPPQTDAYGAKPVIGLMGGPGSGKSTVARCFAELGCAVIDADELAHTALQTESVKGRLRSRWGDDIFDGMGQVVRPRLGQLVFGDPAALKELEAIIHPLVHEGRSLARECHRSNPGMVAIVEDCPLLLESGLDKDCDILVFVDTPDAIRLERVRAERGWDAAELKKRDERQLSLDTKRQSADYVIRNDQQLAHIKEQVRHVLQRITHEMP